MGPATPGIRDLGEGYENASSSGTPAGHLVENLPLKGLGCIFLLSMPSQPLGAPLLSPFSYKIPLTL